MPNYRFPQQPRGRGIRAAAALAVLALLAVGCGSDQGDDKDGGKEPAAAKQPPAAPDKPAPDDDKPNKSAGDPEKKAGADGEGGAAEKADPEQIHQDGKSSFSPSGGGVDSLSLDEVTCQGASAKTLFVSAAGEGAGKSAQFVVSVQKGKAAGATLTVGKDEKGGKTWQADSTDLGSAISVETKDATDRLVVDDLTLTEFSSDEEMTLSGELDCA